MPRKAPAADPQTDGIDEEAARLDVDSRAKSFGQEMRDQAATLTAPDPDADLHARIAWIFMHVPDVPKLGHADVKNKEGKFLYSYDYVREPEMMNAIRPLLGRAGVAAYSKLDQSRKDGNMTTIRMVMEFVYGEQREQISVEASGSDSGDRATIKAVTTGMRYLLQKQFMIATDGIDPEQENVEHVPARSQLRQPQPARARRASGPPQGMITPQARGTLFARARELFISEERVKMILRFASEGKVQSAADVKTNEQLDWAHRQLDRYHADPEQAEQAFAEAGILTPTSDPDAEPPKQGGVAAKQSPEEIEANLTDEERAALNEPDSQPPHDDPDSDVPF